MLRRLALFLLVLASMLCANLASAKTDMGTKTRVRAIDVAAQTFIEGRGRLKEESLRENGCAYGESALGNRLAAEGIGATGRVGEEALQALGGESQVFFRTSQGGRFVDQLVEGVAHESKVGYTSLTKDVARQIGKDAELLGTRQVEGYTWHFFQSPVTGRIGPSGPLQQALENAGIGVEVHF